ncbi:MAG: type IV secretion system DNA-binding domain-containing protein [bacterium]|nr:type IV secretion system DNA-binding domain-containing protein [bacterium]
MTSAGQDEKRELMPLSDIRRLLESGEPDDAMTHIDAFLDVHPDDEEARLLKVEICFEARRDFLFVSNTLKALESSVGLHDRVAELHQRRRALVEELITEGRGRIMRQITDGVPLFENALVLELDDPSVPFAAALALLKWKEEKRDELQPGLFGSLFPVPEGRRRIFLRAWSKHLEKYLRLARERSHAGDAVHQKATEKLIHFWLSQSEVNPDLLALLSDPAQPSDEITQLTRKALVKVIEHAGGLVARLVRREDDAEAARLIDAAALYAGCVPVIAYLQGEMALIAGDQAAAQAAFQRALTPAPLRMKAKTALHVARRIFKAISGVSVTCKHCGRVTSMPEQVCSLCENNLNTRKLTDDRYPIEPENTEVLARVALAEMLRDSAPEAAGQHIRAAIETLGSEHRAVGALNELLGATESQTEKEQNPALHLVERLRDEGLTPAMLHQINRLTEKHPAKWMELPSAGRVSVVRRLLKDGALKPATAVMRAAFGDAPRRGSVRTLQTELDHAIRAASAEAMRAAQRELDSSDAEGAIQMLSGAMELDPSDSMILLRGKARMLAGHDAPALDDFYRLVATSSDAVTVQEARKGIAALLEKRWDLAGAKSVLEAAGADSDVREALARVERRKRGEPYVLVERTDERVIEDTLLRKQVAPYYQGIFAVAIREVGRPNMPFEAWMNRLLVASFEFVQVIGAFRELLYDVTFALRVIAVPHPQIAERGQIKIALLVRIGSEVPDLCRMQALELWSDLKTALPLTQDGVFMFEPIPDEPELRTLIAPFTVDHAAEIVRRETNPDSDGVYTAAPFLPGSLDLHNLLWVMLRQDKPSMLSVHLKPTQLYSWERSAAMYTTAADTGVRYADTLAYWESEQPITPEGFNAPAMMSRLNQMSQMERTRGHFVRLSYLRSAYIVRINVAGHAGTSKLLPEMIAASLLGPLRDGGENGGYEIMRALRGQEFDTAQRNLHGIDVEAWGYSHAPEKMRRLRYLVGEAEATHVFRLPIPHYSGVPGMRSLDGKPIPPPVGMPENGTVLGVSTARTGNSVPALIRQSRDDRRRHSYIVGKTGMGKSTLIASMVLQDIDAGYGVFLLDPHGDLVEDVLARIPRHRADDVILIDPSDEERPVGLNILNPQNEADRHRITNDFIGMLIRMYDPYNQGIVGPIFQQFVRNAMLAAMWLENGTLIDVYRILSDQQYVRKILPKIGDPIVKNFWEDIASRTENASPQWRAELLPYLLSKFSRFVEDSILRRILGQPRTSVPWRDVMSDGKIVLVNLAKGKIGTETSQFLGLLILGDLLQAAFQRSKLPPDQRRDFYIYIDEVQNYSTPLLSTMISEGRKFGVSLVIANQFLHQLDHGIREAVFGNIGSLISFRVGVQDAPALAPEYYPTFTAEDLIELGQFTASVKLLVNGVGARAFTMRTLLPSQTPNPVIGEDIRQMSRARYGTAIAQVEREIKAQF